MENSEGTTGGAASPDDATRRIKDAAGTVLERTKQAAADTANRGKDSVVSSVQTAASSLRRAADDAQNENAMIGKALRSFADGLDKASTSLGGGDLNRTLRSVNDFARREPAIFLGASFALGFALARVGKTALESHPSGGESMADIQQGYDAFGG